MATVKGRAVVETTIDVSFDWPCFVWVIWLGDVWDMRKHLRIRDVFSFFNDSTGERCGGLPTGSSHPAGFILSKDEESSVCVLFESSAIVFLSDGPCRFWFWCDFPAWHINEAISRPPKEKENNLGCFLLRCHATCGLDRDLCGVPVIIERNVTLILNLVQMYTGFSTILARYSTRSLET
jgi:hypothetical protein